MSYQEITPCGEQGAIVEMDLSQINSTLSPIGQAALEYAERGWKVFPLRAGTKKGHYLDNGHNGASSDVEQVRAWWTRWTDANIGLNLKASGLVAVDPDIYKPECGWTEFCAKNGIDEIDTLTQRSASGGWHYIFECKPDDEFPGTACKEVEIKHKGYIMLDPSTFEGKPYVWHNDDDAAPVPDWVPRKAVRDYSEISVQTATPDDVARAIDMLRSAKNDLDRHDWVRLGMALKASCGEAARDAWLEFSYRWPGVTPGDPEETWEKLRPNGSNGLGSVFHLLSDGKPLDLGHSDDELARELGRRSWNRNARFVSLRGKWLFWDGSKWALDERRANFTRVREYLKLRANEFLEWAETEGIKNCGTEPQKFLAKCRAEARAMRGAARIAAVESLAQSNAESAALPQDFDADPYLMGTPGGTVDLRTGILRTAERGDMISKAASVTPAQEGAEPVQWLKFLDRVMAGDAEQIHFLQRLAGYALTGLTTEHKLFFLYGTGRNGKSVFLETLQGIFAEYAQRAAAETFLQSQGERHPTDIAKLDGARLVIGSELPRGKVWNETVIKDLTGGETMTARFMRQDHFEFKPQLTLLIAGNTQPSIRGVDEAMRARLVMVPFTVTIPEDERDPELPQKLRDEWPAILRWCIEGCLDWQTYGLAVPDSIKAASAEYLDSEDIIGQFLGDRTERDASVFTSWSELHSQFEYWMTEQGLQAWSQNQFTKEIKGRGYNQLKRNGTRGTLGLRLK